MRVTGRDFTGGREKRRSSSQVAKLTWDMALFFRKNYPRDAITFHNRKRGGRERGEKGGRKGERSGYGEVRTEKRRERKGEEKS